MVFLSACNDDERAAPAIRPDDFFSATYQRVLADWNRQRLAPEFSGPMWRESLESDYHMRRLEGEYLETLKEAVQDQAVLAPRDPEGFIAWFEDLRETGPGQNDALFPWLARRATVDELRWFFEQKAAGEAGFEDLIAMTQVSLPLTAKLAFARTYWDEMGRGSAKRAHAPIWNILEQALGVTPRIETTVSESLALANAMTGMATSRRFTWHSVGALGVTKLTTPGRSALVAEGLRRIGISARACHYFDLHAVLDTRRSGAWNRAALYPLVKNDSRRALAIAEGALMRLTCDKRCFDRYRTYLWDK